MWPDQTTARPLEWIRFAKLMPWSKPTPGQHGRERVRDAVEGVVVVVQDDHLPGRVETAARIAGPRLADRCHGRRAHRREDVPTARYRLRADEARGTARALRTPGRRGGLEHRRGPGRVGLALCPSMRRSSRAIARVAYENGARYVDVDYTDQHVRRARIQHRRRGHARLDAALDAREGRLPRRAARRADPHRRRPGAGAARRPRRRARRQDADARARRALRQGDEPAPAQLDDRRLPERGLGDSPSSASPTSSGSGTPSPRRRGSTSPIRSRRGGSTSEARRARRAAERAPVRLPPLPRPRHRPHRRPDRRARTGARRSRRPSTAAGTSSTCRPRRSSRPPTAAAPRASSARRSRSRSPATSSATSRCASRAAARSR